MLSRQSRTHSGGPDGRDGTRRRLDAGNTASLKPSLGIIVKVTSNAWGMQEGILRNMTCSRLNSRHSADMI